MQWLLLILIIPYIYMLARTYLGLHRIVPFNKAKEPDLFISVVVACRNEEQHLGQLLYDLSLQDYDPGKFEVIIVDDNSTDRTARVASEFSGIKNFTVIMNKGIGKKMAISTGVEATSGTIIVTTDADCRTSPGWIGTIAAFFHDHKPDLLVCPVTLTAQKGFLSWFQTIEFLGLQGITAGMAVIGKPVMCNGANLAFTREIYTKHRDELEFGIPTGDDVFLLHSIKRNKNNRISWLDSREAIVRTKISGSLYALLRQRARWISKAGAYYDRDTIQTGIVTFVTILLLAFLPFAGIFDTRFLPVFAVALILKSMPDYLVIKNTAARYGSAVSMRWFFPSQLIYPFYVLVVLVFSVRGQSEHRA